MSLYAVTDNSFQRQMCSVRRPTIPLQSDRGQPAPGGPTRRTPFRALRNFMVRWGGEQ